MRIEGETVIFNTANDYYDGEKNGEKPYTIRLLTGEEYRLLISPTVSKIRIAHAVMPEKVFFDRTIRSIYDLAELLGNVLVGIAWIHEEEKELPEQ